MYNFKEVEGQAREIWEKHEKEIEKSVQERRGRLFSFLEGPPTANAPPGLHHLELRTYKDLICKFKFMQGFSVPRKGGWDCHGLPVEVQIEKKLNLNSKKDIEKHGVEKFIKECRESVFSYIEEWEKSTQELNYWIDLENPYRTLDNDYTESVWWSLKELYNKKLLYEDKKVVPFCPRCETPLSSHEVAQGYKKLKEETIVAKFKLESGEYMLAWTTTPWTLPSNLALAVNQNIDYAVVEKDGRKYILAKELVKNFFSKAKIIKTFKGEDLLGKKYEPLLPYYNNLKNSFKIIEGDFVELVRDAGCDNIILSPDGFSEIVLKRLGKNITKKDIIKSYNILKGLDGFEVGYNFFKNPPSQSFLAFISLIIFYIKAKLQMKGRVHFEFNSLRIEPHTRLYRIAIEEGFVKEGASLLHPNYYTNPRTRYIEKFFNALLKLKKK